MSPAVCQACRAEPAAAIVENGSAPPFLVCRDCKDRVLTRALRPREWYNLAVAHGPLCYHLHDDFYDEHGTALQPAAPPIEPGAHPAPRLEQVSDSLDALLEFCATRFTLTARHYLALAQFPRDQLAAALEWRLRDGPAPHLQFMCFNVAANVLRQGAAALFRRHFAAWRPEAPRMWAAAAIKCLPRDEVEALVWDLLAAGGDPRYLQEVTAALAYCRTPAALDWIESAIGHPPSVLQFWGDLAAKSGLSWPRAQRWLKQGRPMSLVALDAFAAIARLRATPCEFNDASLADVADRAAVIAALQNYATRDSVPRVTKAVARIIENIDSICA
jgi:hypothetical protein